MAEGITSLRTSYRGNGWRFRWVYCVQLRPIWVPWTTGLGVHASYIHRLVKYHCTVHTGLMESNATAPIGSISCSHRSRPQVVLHITYEIMLVEVSGGCRTQPCQLCGMPGLYGRIQLVGTGILYSVLCLLWIVGGFLTCTPYVERIERRSSKVRQRTNGHDR